MLVDCYQTKSNILWSNQFTWRFLFQWERIFEVSSIVLRMCFQGSLKQRLSIKSSCKLEIFKKICRSWKRGRGFNYWFNECKSFLLVWKSFSWSKQTQEGSRIISKSNTTWSKWLLDFVWLFCFLKLVGREK